MVQMKPAGAKAATRLHWVAILLLLVLTYAVFSKALAWQFVGFDDPRNITENPDIAALDWPHLKAMFTDIKRAHRYLPLGWMSYAVDRHFFGLSAFSYHAGNLLLHLLNTVLVYFLLRRLVVAAVSASALAAKPFALVIGPALGALLWALNPLRVEPVAWSSARIYLVASAFFFSALLAYLRSAQAELAGENGGRWRWLAVAAYSASLLTYPIAIFGVWIFVLLEVYPLRRVPMASPWRAPVGIWLRLAPFALVAGILFALMLWHNHLIPQQLSKLDPPRNFGTPAHKFMQGFFVWGYFAWKPWLPTDLSPQYPTLLSFEPFTAPFLLSVAGVAGVSVWLFLRRTRWPAVWIGWLAHLGFLVPMLGLAEIRYHPGDRYTYIIAVVPFALLAGAIWRFWHSSFLRPALVGVGAAAIAFAGLSTRQLEAWRNPTTLRECIARRAGDTIFRPAMDAALAAAYFAEGSNELAARTAKAALEKSPDLTVAMLTLADVDQADGKLDAALAGYERVLGMDPESIEARVNRGVVLGKQGKLEESAAAFHAILQALPQHPGARQNLAYVLELQGKTNEMRLVTSGRLPPIKIAGR